ncbi:IS5 family transposase [Sorangium sp. So ce124]
MGKLLVPDELWERIVPLLPKTEPKPQGGRPRTPDRIALTGILFVLKTGIPWEYLPQELGCSGMTCWRRLRDWQQAGVWDRLHEVLLDELGEADRINWERAALDASLVPGKKGGEKTGPNPTDRGRPGTKYHILVDRNGIPLAVEMTPANVHDSRMFTSMVDAVPPIARPCGRPRRRPKKLDADKAYDDPALRLACHLRHIVPRIARKGIESSEKLGRYRWVVERTIAWIRRFRRLTVRYERRADIHRAFLLLAVCVICLNHIPTGFC